MMDYWAKPTCPRHQLLLYAPSLDDAISADHPIRELDAVIKELDWSDWESRYNGRRGQPPIHPSLIAGVILYGLLDGLRSSRRLERATHNRIDIIWFLSGITIDHSTFAGFRRKFEKELKGLSRTIVKLALEKANSKLAELAIDGTRVRAWSGRNGARTAECLEKLLTEVETGIGNALEEMKALDAADDPEQASVEELQEEVGRLDGEREKLLKALEVARERDATKQKKEGKGAKAVRVPVTDPDSNIMPNKEGGYAPNYTPTTAVDRDSGVIMDSDVVEANAEAD